MRTASRRVAWPSGCLHLVARGALGYRRPPGQSWAHPYRPNPIMGEGAIDEWKEAGGITEGSLFRSINKTGRVWGTGMTPKVLWEVVRAAAKRAGIEKLAPHDLRRYAACGIVAVAARGSAILPVVSWTRSNFCLDTSRSKRRNGTSAASRNCALPSTTEWASNRTIRRLRSRVCP